MTDLSRIAQEMLLPECPQCRSRFCGPVRCRFSGFTHDNYFWNQGTLQAELDRQVPAWLRALKTGEKETT